jgi:hypothetical protein
MESLPPFSAGHASVPRKKLAKRTVRMRKVLVLLPEFKFPHLLLDG